MSDIKYHLVPFEEFVASIPQDKDLMLIGQRQSGRTLTINAIQTVMKRAGDTSKLKRSEWVELDDGSVKEVTHDSPKGYYTELVYQGEKHRFDQFLPKDYTGKVKHAYQVAPRNLGQVMNEAARIFVVPVKFPAGGTFFLLVKNAPESVDAERLVSALHVKTFTYTEPTQVEDGFFALADILVWLRTIEFKPTSKPLVVNPYWLPEKAYVDLVSTRLVDITAYNYIMAQTLLDLNGPVKFSYMHEGKKIIVAFGWENARSVPAANNDLAVPPTTTIN